MTTIDGFDYFDLRIEPDLRFDRHPAWYSNLRYATDPSLSATLAIGLRRRIRALFLLVR